MAIIEEEEEEDKRKPESNRYKNKSSTPRLRGEFEGRHDIVSTGTPKLDGSLGGGFLSNSMVLIAHQASYRYAELLNCILPAEIGREFYLILVDYGRHVEDLFYKMGVFELKGEKVKNDRVLSLDRMRIINCFSSEVGNEKYLYNDKMYTLDDPFDNDKLFSIMKTVRESLPENAWVVWLFFSLTDLSIGVSEPYITRFFRRVSRLHKQYGDLAFYPLNMDAHSTKFQAMISHMTDVIINFKREDTGEKLKNYIQVIKGPFLINTKRLYYDIDSNGNFIYY
ncbi:MAG: hypothetical protein WED07_12815 [Candidatus Freyarchaeum deiterrae]